MLCGAALFLLPGLSFLGLLPRAQRDRLGFDERLYLLLAVSTAAAAWIALALAEQARFSLPHAGLASLLLCLLSGLVAAAVRRRRGIEIASWPLARPRHSGEWAPALLLLGLGLGLFTRPSEYLVGGRDPGAYVAAMGTISRTGAIAHVDQVVRSIPPADYELFYRFPDRPQAFSWSRFMGFDLERPQTGVVVPQFFHLFPAFGALLFQAFGVKGALATPPVFGLLGLLGAFLLLRRLFGSAPALLGSLLLGLNVLSVWFARYPVSETLSQALLMLGLLAFCIWEDSRSAWLGALSGSALGLSLLVRIDAVLLVLPLGLFVLVRRSRRTHSWAELSSVLLPFAALAVHAAVHAELFATQYVRSILNRPYWQQPLGVWIALASLGVASIVVSDRLGPKLACELAPRAASLRTALGVALLLLLGYAAAVRPALSAWAGGDGNLPGSAVAGGVVLESLRELGFRRLAAHDAQSLVRLGWFVTPLALLLGALGGVLVLREWKERYLLPLSVFLVFSSFYLYKIRVFNDYPFAMRRYLPATLPLLLGLAALVLVRFASRGAGRRLLSSALAAGLLVWSGLESSRIWRYTDWRGSVAFVADLARHFGPKDVVIFEQPKSLHLLSLPLWAAWDVHGLELARFDPDPAKLSDLVLAWSSRWRNLYFVHTYNTNLCGLFLERVQELSFGTFEWYAYNRKPEAPEFRSLRFTLSRVVPPAQIRVPPLELVDLGGSDDVMVSGFYDKEGGGDRTFRWSGSCASVYVPGASAGGFVPLTLAPGHRPADRPAVVSVSLSGRSLGQVSLAPGWGDYRLSLPTELPPGPAVLRLDVPAWRPVNVLQGADDIRDLGVMLDRVRLEKSLQPRVLASQPSRP